MKAAKSVLSTNSFLCFAQQKWKNFFNFPYADFQSTDNYNFQGDDTLVQPHEGLPRGKSDEARDDINFATTLHQEN